VSVIERSLIKAIVFALTGFLVASPAFAGRDVKPEERASIEKALAAQGCSGGVKNFDDEKDRFEVHDTRCNGRKMELFLNSRYRSLG
jgi:hypothetical protein